MLWLNAVGILLLKPREGCQYNESNRRKGETYQDMAIGEAVYDQASKRADGACYDSSRPQPR